MPSVETTLSWKYICLQLLGKIKTEEIKKKRKIKKMLPVGNKGAVMDHRKQNSMHVLFTFPVSDYKWTSTLRGKQNDWGARAVNEVCET